MVCLLAPVVSCYRKLPVSSSARVPGGGEVLREILYGEAQPGCLTPYFVINHCGQERYPFGIPFSDKWYLFHMPIV